MIIHDVTQGSPEWNALRANHNTASEAPAMMGVSKYQSRNELMQQKKTGASEEVSPAKQALYDRGHETEASARKIVESMIGEDLYPVTASNGNLLASMDGMDMAETLLFEHKLWNTKLAAQVIAKDLAPHYYWQLEQQLLVTGAERVIFVCSDGTEDNFEYMYYTPVAGRAQELLNGWEQFNIDLANFTPTEVKAATVAAPVVNLPTINYKLNGLALTSNLDLFRKAAEKAVEDSKKELKTDQDFANREALNKSFGDAETKIKVLQDQVVGEFQDIAQFTRELGEIGELIRKARLAGEKQVSARKEAIKLEIRQTGVDAFAEHVAVINKRLGKVQLPSIAADFAGVMKGKRTIATLQDAVDTELARVKIIANELAENIETNLATLREEAVGYENLFVDAQELVLKDNDHLKAIITSRVSEQKRIEKERADAEELARQEEIDRINSGEPDPAFAEALLTPSATPEPVAAQAEAPSASAAPAPARGTGGGSMRQASTWHAVVTDKSALIAAIAAGYGTEDLLIIDQAALDSLANDKRQALELAGVIAEPVPATKAA